MTTLSTAILNYCKDKQSIIQQDIKRIKSHYPDDEARLNRILGKKETLAVLCQIQSITDEYLNGNRNFEYLTKTGGSRQRNPSLLARYQAAGLVTPAQEQSDEAPPPSPDHNSNTQNKQTHPLPQ